MPGLNSKFPIAGKMKDLIKLGAKPLEKTTYLILNVDGKDLIYEPNLPLEEDSEKQYFSLRERCLFEGN